MSEENKTDKQLGDEWAQAIAEQDSQDKASEIDELMAGADDGAMAGFDELASGSTNTLPQVSDDGEHPNLDVILDIPVTISMEVGRTKISIRNLLQLSQGSVVELDRLAGEPLDVMVNGTLIAHGEVVVVNDKFGIRLTDVISASERIKKLK